MTLLKRVRTMIRGVVLGNTDLPQQCTIGMPDPQDEISVWLYGAGEPRDVTNAHAPACAFPFTVGICTENEIDKPADLSLRFCERHGGRRLLGVITLRPTGVVNTSDQPLHLFEARSCRNFCLPRVRLFAHDLFRAYIRLRTGGDPSVPMDLLSSGSMAVFFICPRPVVLVSVIHSETGNIFPMNLMGTIGRRHMAFALNSSRQACRSLERAGRAVLSNIPFDQAEVARRLGGQHRQESVNWTKLPFETMPSTTYGIPTPCFAQRVREVEIEVVRKLGSHTLFVARVLRDMRRAEGPQFTMIHGIYQARRQGAASMSNACM